MSQPDCDVIIVGAGAGGAAAAYHLTRQGLRVLVVEKAILPRYKACGGAIPRPTLARLPSAVEAVVRAVPEEVRFTYPGQLPVDVALPDRPVVMVMRSEFDAWLLAQSGAEVQDGVAVSGVEETEDDVRVQAGERVLTARYLVGADGAASIVARRLGLRRNRRLGGTLEAEVPLAGRPRLEAEYARRAVFALGVLPWSYGWVFPKGDHLSVGIGRYRPGRADLRLALRQAMDGLGVPLDGVALHGHPIPCYQAPRWPFWQRQPQEGLATRRCVLVGDAAGLVDPLIGEGIRYALASGRLAAEAIARRDLSRYDGEVWRQTGHSLASASLVARLFYGWPRASFRLGVRNPIIVDQFVDLLTERTSYQGIGRRLVWATVRWLLQGRRTKDG